MFAGGVGGDTGADYDNTLTCPAGSTMTGVQGLAGIVLFGGNVVDTLGVRCTDRTGEVITTPAVGIPAPGTSPFSLNCPAGKTWWGFSEARAACWNRIGDSRPEPRHGSDRALPARQGREAATGIAAGCWRLSVDQEHLVGLSRRPRCRVPSFTAAHRAFASGIGGRSGCRSSVRSSPRRSLPRGIDEFPARPPAASSRLGGCRSPDHDARASCRRGSTPAEPVPRQRRLPRVDSAWPFQKLPVHPRHGIDLPSAESAASSSARRHPLYTIITVPRATRRHRSDPLRRRQHVIRRRTASSNRGPASRTSARSTSNRAVVLGSNLRRSGDRPPRCRRRPTTPLVCASRTTLGGEVDPVGLPSATSCFAASAAVHREFTTASRGTLWRNSWFDAERHRFLLRRCEVAGVHREQRDVVPPARSVRWIADAFVKSSSARAMSQLCPARRRGF